MNDEHTPSDQPIPPTPPMPPTAPPTQVDPSMLSMRKKKEIWPSWLAILCIVFGALGILNYAICAPVGLVMQGFTEDFTQQMAANNPNMPNQQAAFDAARSGQTMTIVYMVLSAALAITLLVGGIRMNKQHHSAWMILVVWAVARMIIAVGHSFHDWTMFQGQMDALNQQIAAQGQAQMPGFVTNIASGAGIFGVILTFGIRLTLPIVVLCLLLPAKGRPPKTEDGAVAHRGPELP